MPIDSAAKNKPTDQPIDQRTDQQTDQQLVSIICRSIGRPELKQALASVGSQNYSNIELILVDAAAKDLSGYAADCDPVPLRVINTGKKLSRSQAANAGLDAAEGAFVMFLDDDDWIADNHVEVLVEALNKQTDIRAAYSSTRKTDAAGNPSGYIFAETYNPQLLMRDNYIPIHAMLFEKSLLDEGCRFDESFDIYEDWDFWLQLNQYTAFTHIDQITAFYREGGESATAEDDVQLRYASDNLLGRARANIFGKWLKRWSGEQLNSLIGDMDRSYQVADVAEKLKLEHQTNLEHQRVIKQLSQELEQAIHRSNVSEQTLAETNQKLVDSGKQIEQYQSVEADLRARVADVENALNEILRSRTWRIMAPVRYAGRLVRKVLHPSSKKPDGEK